MSGCTAEVVFSVIHQYGGVVLGEHLGQLFTIIWTVAMVYVLRLYLRGQLLVKPTPARR